MPFSVKKIRKKYFRLGILTIQMSFIRKLTVFAVVVSLLLNAYIYTYPSLDPQSCSWGLEKPVVNHAENGLITRIRKIPYFGDLYNQYVDPIKVKKSKTVDDIKMLAFGDPQINGNWKTTPYIKQLDNYGNDHYLGHIYQTMKKRLQPNYVAVLGDLFSSQWIGDSEFFNRTKRYVTRLYDQPDDHREYVLNFIKEHDSIDWIDYLNKKKAITENNIHDLQFGYSDVYDWNTPNYVKKYANEPLFLNVSGNHDIGYSGDATWQHMARYTELFGQDNFWIEYNLNTPFAYRIVVLNSLLLEGPALQPEFLEYTWEFLYQLFERNFKGATILLTHVPFYKEEGFCVDGPHNSYYGQDAQESYKVDKLRSQNHLSKDVSQRVLSLIFNDYPGVILTGHDHEGCETWYNKNYTTSEWYATKTKKESVAIKEITVRAMMGEYGGNSGLLHGKFNEKLENWEFKFNLCPFMVQHIWWAAKVTAILSLLLFSVVFVFDL